MNNLYLIYQDINNGYETFDSAVVVAENESLAKSIHPSQLHADDYSYPIIVENDMFIDCDKDNPTYHISWIKSWCNNIKDVQVKLIGIASDDLNAGDVICSSFNAG